MANQVCRLKPFKLGFAMGLIWGIGLLLLGLAGWRYGYGLLFIRVMGSIYHGYMPTVQGSVLGGLWGFIDFFIFGLLLAWVYNCGCKKD